MRYPRPFHDGQGLAEDEFARRELQLMEQAMANLVAGEQLAAVIVEPVLGEGGFIPAPRSYLRRLREFCDTHNILLI